jgi:hypothetical protein
MKSYSYSEARRNLATVLDKAELDGDVEIRPAGRVRVPHSAAAKIQGIAAGCEGCEARSVGLLTWLRLCARVGSGGRVSRFEDGERSVRPRISRPRISPEFLTSLGAL